jgi:hypothetical protein
MKEEETGSSQQLDEGREQSNIQLLGEGGGRHELLR